MRCAKGMHGSAAKTLAQLGREGVSLLHQANAAPARTHVFERARRAELAAQTQRAAATRRVDKLDIRARLSGGKEVEEEAAPRHLERRAQGLRVGLQDPTHVCGLVGIDRVAEAHLLAAQSSAELTRRRESLLGSGTACGGRDAGGRARRAREAAAQIVHARVQADDGETSPRGFGWRRARAQQDGAVGLVGGDRVAHEVGKASGRARPLVRCHSVKEEQLGAQGATTSRIRR